MEELDALLDTAQKNVLAAIEVLVKADKLTRGKAGVYELLHEFCDGGYWDALTVARYISRARLITTQG